MASLEAARTAVWWDIDWCAVPPGCCDPHRIARNIITALAAAGCNGPVSIFAYGDASRIAPGVLEAISATGITLNHVSAGVKDGVDKKMLVDMVFWAYDNPPPGNYLLISGDQDFSDLLHRLKMKQYGILLAIPPNASSQALFSAAKTVWLWESLAAGDPLLAESPRSSSNWNLNNSDAPKCSQSKVCAMYNKSDRNLKVGVVKPLQKYVKKTYVAASFASNQAHVEPVDEVSEDSTGSIVSELERSSVSSSSSSESMEGAKVDQSSLLGMTNLFWSSAQKPDGFAHLQQMEISQGSILSEEPSISTKWAPITSISNERKVKPLQKYVKKTNITSSSGNQVDSVGVDDCSIKSTRSELHLSTVLSSSSKSLEGVKVDHASPPGTSTLFQSSAQKPVVSMHQVRAPQKSMLGKKPSTGHVSRDGNHDFGINIGRTSQEHSKCHSKHNVGANNGKAGNQYKVKQHQEYAKKTNISCSSANNEMHLGFPGNSKESILGDPSKSVSSSSCSESLGGTKVNRPSSLPSAQKPVTPTHMHQVEAEFIFGKKPSTSVDCMPKNETFCFGASNGHYDLTFQQSQSSLLLKQENLGPPCQHSPFGQSYSMNSDTGSSLPPSAGHNGATSSQQQTWASGSTFQGLNDICSDMGRLTISECPQGTVETRPPSQATPANFPFSSVPYVSGYPDPNTSFYPNHSSASQRVQPPSNDYTCIPHPPNLACNMKKPGIHGETQGSPPSSSEPQDAIIKALDILKTEKIHPSESNIADCICYGEMNLFGFDVKKALELAIRHQAVIMKKLVNDMPLFVAKDESLWKCVDVTNSNAKHPKALDTLCKFISSTNGHSAIKNSQSRYQAATILKKMCLQHHALGDVLQILHIAIVRKKWIVPHSSGWQPLSFDTMVVNGTGDAIGEARS